MQARTVLLTDTDELTSKLDAEPALFSLLAAFPSLPFPSLHPYLLCGP